MFMFTTEPTQLVFLSNNRADFDAGPVQSNLHRIFFIYIMDFLLLYTEFCDFVVVCYDLRTAL
jgi:hypothetical protein